MINLNLQLFANEVVAADVEPAISIDLTNRIASSIKALQELFGITRLQGMSEGSLIKIYKTVVKNYSDDAAEGTEIPLSEVERKLANSIEITLKKIRKRTTAEAIAKTNQNIAVNETDQALIEETQKRIKAAFFDNMDFESVDLTGHQAANIQAALADCWAQAENVFEDKDVSMAYFVNPKDVATYLANANITVQDKFGFSYVENFMGLGTLIITPKIAAGKVYGTPKENLNGAYVSSSSDLAKAFALTYDATGIVGMSHSAVTSHAGIDTLIMYGVEFFPEVTDGIVGCEIVGA